MFSNQKVAEMIELKGISNLDQIIACLDSLLTYRDETGAINPIITGYNLYSSIPNADSSIIFSHMHESDTYMQAMLSDLEKFGYSREYVLKNIREKESAFLWELDFRIRGEGHEPYSGLKIRDIRTGLFLDLMQYGGENLEAYPELECVLLGEDYGWELNLPFENKNQLLTLSDLFVKKSFKYDKDAWPDAYKVPVIILGSALAIYEYYLQNFSKAIKIYIQENGNEISFIINRNFSRLKQSMQYKTLLRLGFREELCLVNNIFLSKFVEKERKN